jgi:micrococcal nuclease
VERLRRWFLARSLPVKIVLVLLGAWLVISVLQALYANVFALFLASLAIFVLLLVAHVVRAGSDSDRPPEQTLGRWGAAVASVAMVTTILFGGVALAKTVFGGEEPEQAAPPERTEQWQVAAPTEQTREQTSEHTTEEAEQPVAAATQDEEDAAEPQPRIKKQEPPQQPQRQAPLPPSTEDKLAELGKVVAVSYVVDGDTIDISPAVGNISRVRLIGVDTPETYGGTEPYGQEASAFTTQRLEGRKVALEFDAERIDPYGRVLAYAWLPDGKMFNEVRVRQGFAQVATFPPNVKYVERFLAAQRQARAEDAGLWGLSRSQQCELANRGNGIGEGSPRCGGPASREQAPAPAFRDRDCADFGSQAEAQEVLEDNLSDPNSLDGDSDGVACEELPGGNSASPTGSPKASPSGGLPAAPGGDYDCADLTYSQAQQVLRSDPSDPYQLDGDDDGEACEP